MKTQRADVSELLGKTLTSVEVSGDEIQFCTSDNERYKMYHSQDCCEVVGIDDINGDWDDLIGYPLLIAEEISNDALADQLTEKMRYTDSHTWTFYRFATVKGFVNIRWFGESNGYYSESVDFEKFI